MKAAILVAPEKIEIRQQPMPQAPPGGAVVRVEAALTCGTDVKAYLRGHPMIPMPGPFGHEYAGTIEALAEDAPSRFKVGQAVMGVHSAPCGTCPACLRGQENLCDSIMDTKVLGSFAQYLPIPGRILARNVFPKPDFLDFESAAFLEPLACVVHGQKLFLLATDETPCIFGAGPIGLLHLLLFKAKGARRVLLVELSDQRRKLAESLGAETIDPAKGDPVEAIRKLTGNAGADAVLECTANQKVWSDALLATRPGGTAVMFGGLASGTQGCFDAAHLHYNEVRLLGCFHFSPGDVAEAAGLLVDGRIAPGALISGRFGLAGLEGALKLLAAGDGIKYVIDPWEAL